LLSASEWAGWVAIYLVFLALDVWLVFVVAHGGWQDKVSLVLAIVGVFGLAVALLNKSEVKKALPDVINIGKLTSHKLPYFLGANFRFLAASAEFMRSFILGRSLRPRPDRAVGWTLALAPFWVVGLLVLVAVWLFYFVAVAAYLVLVMPFAYLAYVLVSLPLLRIRDQPGGVEKKNPPFMPEVHPPAIVKNNFVELRIFMVGVISPLFAFVIKLIQLY
jgi:hypothetical protein